MTAEEKQQIRDDIAVGSGSSMLSGVNWREKDTARRLARQRVLEVHAPALLTALESVEEEWGEALDIVREVERTRRSDAWGAVVSRARVLLTRLASPSSPGRGRE